MNVIPREFHPFCRFLRCSTTEVSFLPPRPSHSHVGLLLFLLPTLSTILYTMSTNDGPPPGSSSQSQYSHDANLLRRMAEMELELARLKAAAAAPAAPVVVSEEGGVGVAKKTKTSPRLWPWFLLPMALGVLLGALGPDHSLSRPLGSMYFIALCHAIFLACRSDFGRGVGSWAWRISKQCGLWAWWLFKQYCFFGTGFFVLYYFGEFLSDAAVNHAKESEKWDRTVVASNGRTVITWTNRETGQKQEHVSEEVDDKVDDDLGYSVPPAAPPAASAGPPPAPLPKRIKTWVYCQFMDHSGSLKSFKTLTGGLRTRFVAHVDTGNQANTLISQHLFDMLYPGGQGSVRKGHQTIVGATGHSQTLPVYTIQYCLDGVVSPNGKKLKMNVDAVVQPPTATALLGIEDILLSTKDMQMLYKQFGYVIQPVDRNDFILGRTISS